MALPYIDRALQAWPDHERAVLLLETKAECYASMGEAYMVDTVIDEIAQTDLTPGTLNKAAERFAGVVGIVGNVDFGVPRRWNRGVKLAEAGLRPAFYLMGGELY